MRYTVEIRRNADGLVRVWNDVWMLPPDGCEVDHIAWLWSEGNYGCDCNRAIYFARAAGESEDEAWERECGSEDYAVRVTIYDGRVVLDEFAEVTE